MNLALLSNPDTANGKEALRCILSSYDRSDRSGAFIASQPDPDRVFFRLMSHTYQSLGFDLGHYLDFEDGFSEQALTEALSRPFIHLSGGNTFRFLQSLKMRGSEGRLIDYARSGGVLIGVSAGAMILTPSIQSAVLCGDENSVGLQDLTGLGLVPFMFDPHSEKEPDRADLLPPGLDLLMASDDDACLVIDGDRQLLGNPVLIARGAGR